MSATVHDIVLGRSQNLLVQAPILAPFARRTFQNFGPGSRGLVGHRFAKAFLYDDTGIFCVVSGFSGRGSVRDGAIEEGGGRRAFVSFLGVIFSLVFFHIDQMLEGAGAKGFGVD